MKPMRTDEEPLSDHVQVPEGGFARYRTLDFLDLCIPLGKLPGNRIPESGQRTSQFINRNHL